MDVSSVMAGIGSWRRSRRAARQGCTNSTKKFTEPVEPPERQGVGRRRTPEGTEAINRLESVGDIQDEPGEIQQQEAGGGPLGEATHFLSPREVEMLIAVRSMATGKAPGAGAPSSEVYQRLTGALWAPTLLANTVIRTGKLPKGPDSAAGQARQKPTP